MGVPWPNEVFYYAIVAFDEAGNRGKISNTIAVFIKEEPSTSEPERENSEESNEVNQPLQSRTSSDDSTIYIVAGLVSAILIFIVIGLAVVLRRRYRLTTAVLKDPEHLDSSDEDTSNTSGSSSGGDLNSLKKTILSNGSASPTSDYSSQKSPIPSISETLSWKYRTNTQQSAQPQAHQQRAQRQEVAGVHQRAAERRLIAELDDVKTDCSVVYESSDGGASYEGKMSSGNNAIVPDSPAASSISCQPPRISILEDFSVYRDLSNLNGSDYFSFSQLPNELQSPNVVNIPPYYDVDAAAKRRHESLV